MGTKTEYYVAYEEYVPDIDSDCVFTTPSSPFNDYEKAKQEYITYRDDESKERKNVRLIRKITILEVMKK